ncbi:MAG: hypothetical protein JW744_04825 [Candidatus Diapherotrites archaeon]|uniref:Uncharacterized protein n=1 Tax=Candidatus Iainarchaeum sp. TaxID=3101447 RepID=A0A938YY05_9ARCH|nr:hypothetical protein [Candidatus Diapherotrites archaeon]
MRFNLRQGPWTTIFKGSFLGHDLEMMQNEEGILLTAIYEKQGSETTGALLQAFNLFHAIGEVQNFVEGLSNDALIFSRHDGNTTVHFLIAGSKPEYSKMSEELVAESVDRLIQQVMKREKVLLDVSKAYELQLNPLKQCSGDIKQVFFSQPFIVPLLQKVEGKEEEQPALVQAAGQGEAIILGMTKDEKQLKEPLLFFKNTLVEGPSMQHRMHFLHILIESALISNIVTVVFDSKHYFEGLRRPNRDLGALQRYKVAIEPIGFPVKYFKAVDKVKVDLGSVDIAGMLQAFGCGGATSQLMGQGTTGKSFQSIEKLIEAVDETGSEDRTYMFERNRMKRIIKLMDIIYPDLFNSKNDLEEITKGWFKAIGRASVIEVDDLDERALAVLVNSFLNELADFYSKKHQGKKLNAVVVIPNAEKIFPGKQTRLSGNSVKALKRLQEYGVGFAMTADRALDLDPALTELAEASITIVKENDAAVQLKGKKSYRAMLRPGLSECSETGQAQA